MGIETIILDDRASFNDDATHDDTQAFDSGGLRIRMDDLPSDCLVPTAHYYMSNGHYDPPIAHESSTDVPVGSDVEYSRRMYADAAKNQGQASSQFCLVQIPIGTYAPHFKPTMISWYFKSPAHDESLSLGNYYVWALFSGIGTPGLMTFDWLAMHTGPAHDVHYPNGAGHLLLYEDHLYTYKDGNDYYSFGSVRMFQWPDMTWVKLSLEYDWVNGNFRFYINDTLQTYYTMDQSVAETEMYGPDGWMSLPNEGWFVPLGHLSEDNRNRIDRWIERLLGSVVDDPNFTTPCNMYSATRFSQYNLTSGIYTKTFDPSTLTSSGVINNAVLSWNQTMFTDSNIDVSYTRNWAVDPSRASADSYSTTHVAGNPFDWSSTSFGSNGDGTYKGKETWWLSSNSAFPHWLRYDFGTTPKIISKVCFAPYPYANVSSVRDFIIEASNNGSSWTTLYTGTYADQARVGDEFIFNNTTAYRYYRIRILSTYSTYAYAGMYGVEMRESGSARTPASSIRYLVETRVSNDGGSTYSSWETAINGGNITGLAYGVTKDLLRIQVRVTLETDNQKYQPTIPSMSLALTFDSFLLSVDSGGNYPRLDTTVPRVDVLSLGNYPTLDVVSGPTTSTTSTTTTSTTSTTSTSTTSTTTTSTTSTTSTSTTSTTTTSTTSTTHAPVAPGQVSNPIASYVSLAVPDVYYLLQVKPQKVLVESVDINQEIIKGDDKSESQTLLYGTIKNFVVTLQWNILSDANAAIIWDCWNSIAKGYMYSFEWEHPVDGHIYVVKFDSLVGRNFAPGQARKMSQVRLRIVGYVS